MKLIGNLKKQVENAETKNEKKRLIENAGMLLTDDELEQVSGGKFLEETDPQDLEWYKGSVIGGKGDGD